MRRFVKSILFVLTAIILVGISGNTANAAGNLKLNTKLKTIFVNGSKVRPEYTDSYVFKLKNKPKKYSVEWTSSDESIATVQWMKSGKATVKAVGIGVAEITAKVHDKVTDEIITLSAKVTVKKNCTQIAIVPEYLGDIKVGESIKLEGKMFDEKGTLVTSDVEVTDTLKWVSDNPEVATVDEYGNVKAISRGTAKISLYAAQTKIGTYSKLDQAVVIKDVKVNVIGTMLTGVKQISLNKFTMTFSDSLEEDVKPSDIVVAAVNVKNTVDKVEIDESKCVVTVTTTGSLNENSKYFVSWKEFEGSFVATKGQPAKIQLYTGIKDDCVVAGSSTEIKVRFFNEYGVDITPITEHDVEHEYLMNKISLHVKPVEGAVDTGAWVTENKLMFLESGKKAVVVADYVDIKAVDGKAVEYRISANLTVSSVSEASTVTLDDIMLTNSTLPGSKLDWTKQDHNIIAIGDNDYHIVARMRNAEGKFIYSDELNGKVTFKVSGDASVLGVFSNGTVFPTSSGTDVILVEYEKTPIGAKEVAVVPKREASRIVFEYNDKLISSKKISSNYGVGKCEVVVKVLDQYGSVLKLNSVGNNNYTTELSFDLADSVGPMASCTVDNNGFAHVTVDGSGFGNDVGRIFAYKVKYDGQFGKVSNEFVFIVQIPDKSLESTYEVSLIGGSDVTMDASSVEFPSMKLSLCEYKGEIANSMIEGVYPALDNTPAVNGLYYYRVFDDKGSQIKSGMNFGSFDLVYADGSQLKKYAVGDYTVCIYRGVNGGYEYIAGSTFTVKDSKATVTVEQTSLKSGNVISKNMSANEISGLFAGCFKIMIGNEQVPMSNIIIDSPIVGDRQIIFRTIKVRDYVTVKDTAYYFEYEVAVNKQVVNQ